MQTSQPVKVAHHAESLWIMAIAYWRVKVMMINWSPTAVNLCTHPCSLPPTCMVEEQKASQQHKSQITICELLSLMQTHINLLAPQQLMFHAWIIDQVWIFNSDLTVLNFCCYQLDVSLSYNKEMLPQAAKLRGKAVIGCWGSGFVSKRSRLWHP